MLDSSYKVSPEKDAVLNKEVHLLQHTAQQTQRADLGFYGRVTPHGAIERGTHETRSKRTNRRTNVNQFTPKQIEVKNINAKLQN